MSGCPGISTLMIWSDSLASLTLPDSKVHTQSQAAWEDILWKLGRCRPNLLAAFVFPPSASASGLYRTT